MFTHRLVRLAPLAPPRVFVAVAAALFASPAAAQFKLELPGGFGQPTAQVEPVTVAARIAPATDSQPAALLITADIASGYHIYSLTQPDGGPEATKLSVAAPAGVTVGAFRATPAPETHVDTEIWEGLRIEEHTETVTWFAPLTVASGADVSAAVITGTVDTQACQANSCLPTTLSFTASASPAALPAEIATALASAALVPEATLETAGVTNDATAEGAVEPTDLATLLPILGAALVGGLILNLMPCVLPVIGLKVLSFAEQAQHDRGRVLAMNLAYTAGLMSVFLLLAALTAFAGYGWGELNTHAEYKIGIVVLVFAMALSFLGVWEIPIPGFAGGKNAGDLQQTEGYQGAFYKGVFTTILATPCSGPFLGSAIGYTLGKPAWTPFAVFSAIGLGMAAPYLLIGVFPRLVRFLPKPGAWMETFKHLMGFVLMGAAVYFLSVVSEEQRIPLLATLVAVGFACWWIGTTPITAPSSKKTTAWLGGLGTAVATGVLAFSLLGPNDHELPWRDYSDVALSSAIAEGSTVLVDFTADWCPTCQVNSRYAINTEDVKAVVEANGVTPLLADWSDRNDQIKQTLESLGSRSIPFLAIFPADRPNAPILLPDVITETQLLDALRQAGATAGNTAELELPKIEIGAAAPGGTLR
ncbi:MAG: cytochrome c biogenesis protein CcdA [Planctomycetota bacterium]